MPETDIYAMHACMYVCTYVCMYVCIYLYLYIYIYISFMHLQTNEIRCTKFNSYY
jgi:hypothetical protein